MPAPRAGQGHPRGGHRNCDGGTGIWLSSGSGRSRLPFSEQDEIVKLDRRPRLPQGLRGGLSRVRLLLPDLRLDEDLHEVRVQLLVPSPRRSGCPAPSARARRACRDGRSPSGRRRCRTPSSCGSGWGSPAPGCRGGSRRRPASRGARRRWSGMFCISLVQGMVLRNRKVCVTWLSISLRSASSRLPLGIFSFMYSSSVEEGDRAAALLDEGLAVDLVEDPRRLLGEHGGLVRRDRWSGGTCRSPPGTPPPCGRAPPSAS